MNLIEKIGMVALHKFDPETAHKLALTAMKAGIVPLSGPITTPRLATRFCGMDLLNPVGLAAGYDKNAQVVDALTNAGFGFIEVGAVTPRAQPGNPRPRLFRLTEDQAVINRYGFNNEGMHACAARLTRRSRRHPVPVGLNLGANKDSSNKAGDFAQVLETCGEFVDFATVNVSSPNTEKLRDLQGAEALSQVLENVINTRTGFNKYLPIFVKIAPDLDQNALNEIAQVARAVKIDGIIATNTTLDRDGLKSAMKSESGGLSGAPLFEKSTRILAQLSHLTNGDIPLIGVGGVGSAQDAYDKIRAGASVVQLYSALAFKGLSLVEKIAMGLDDLLKRDGFDQVADAVGTGREDWL